MDNFKKILISIGSPIVHQGNIDEILRIIKEFNNKTKKND